MERARPDADGSASTTTSLQLLRRARRGDREALGLLYERLFSSLRRWARGRLPLWAREGADTSDIVQDVLIRTFRQLDRFEPRQRRALQAYLREAVRNRVRDEVRRFGRRPTAALDGYDTAAPTSPLGDVIQRENAERYAAALAKLEERDRELIVACVELGYSYEQIALMTGKPSPDAARVAIRRALMRLAQEMDAG